MAADGCDEQAMWPEIEATFWDRKKRTRDKENVELQAKYESVTIPLKQDLADLLARRQALSLELQEVTELCNAKQGQIDSVDMDLEDARRSLAAKREEEDEEGRAWFRMNRAPATAAEGDAPAHQAQEHGVPSVANGLGTNGPAEDSDETEVEDEVQRQIQLKSHAAVEAAASQPYAHSHQQTIPSGHRADETFTGVQVCDPDGYLIGPLRRIKRSNHWVEHVLQLPIKRHVTVRRGRKFSLGQLESVYEPSDVKGAKWLSCMIQATGDVQAHQCQSCRDEKGTWAECVIIGGDEFPRCANCEWNRQGCQGSSYAMQTQPAQAEGTQEMLWRPKSQHSEVGNEIERRATSGGFTPVNTVNIVNSSSRRKSADAVSAPKRTSLPNKKGGSRKSMPAGATVDDTEKESVQPDGEPGLVGEGDEMVDPGPEITKDVLVLRHDDVVFTEPEIMRGVPVARIGPDHPYWEPNWKTVEDLIRPKLEQWEEKLDLILKENKNRFLANRQVNRGRTTMAFLRDGVIHPYQFIAKQYLTPSFTSYDTLFRLAQVLEELPKFGLDMTPLEWLRQRMHELWIEQGDQFNLAKTVHDLYRDPKLKALRSKCGFGNIGRPSGIKTGARRSTNALKSEQKGKEDQDASPDPALTSAPALAEETEKKKKKRRPQSLGDGQREVKLEGSELPMMPRGPSKKQRLEQISTPMPQVHGLEAGAFVDPNAADFDYSGYTTSDSFSGDRVMKIDWRVYQIRHAKKTTNPGHTQYWHWVNTGGEGDGGKVEQLFEHQVLRTMAPPGWGVYKEPLDFHLRLKELDKVEYAPGCLKVVVHTTRIPGVEYRGDVLAFFKRDRTVKRFLSFLRKKGMPLVKTDKTSIEAQWDNMDSEMLPHSDSE